MGQRRIHTRRERGVLGVTRLLYRKVAVIPSRIRNNNERDRTKCKMPNETAKRVRFVL